MSTLICQGCGAVTNTVFCDYLEHKEDHLPRKCYAKFVDGYWRRGCAFDQADAFTKTSVNRTILSHAFRKLIAGFLEESDPTIGKEWAVQRVLEVMKVFGLEIDPDFLKAFEDGDNDLALMWLGHPRKVEKKD